LQEDCRGKRSQLVMGRSPSPIAVHRLNLAEQRVLSSFLAGRLPAGQVHVELQRARTAPAAPPAPQPEPQAALQAPAMEPVPAVAA
jgi:hypothetical protein